MRKVIASLFLCILFISAQAQQTDSVKIAKNEIGINLVPAISAMGEGYGRYVNNKLQYKRRINSNLWYKASIAYITNRSAVDWFVPNYYIIAETDSTRSVNYSFHGVSNEFYISQGIEYRFGKKKIKQFTGLDLGYAKSSHFDEDRSGIFKKDYYNSVTKQGGNFDFRNSILDSTVTHSETKNNTIVFTPFYGARFNITNRLLFSMQLGLNLRFGFSKQTFEVDNSNSYPSSQNYTNLDFSTNGILNDFSLFYRF